jgi:hypothetical protein
MFAYTKGAIWSRKSKMNRLLKTMIYKTLHRKLMIEQHESYLNPVVSSCAPEG